MLELGTVFEWKQMEMYILKIKEVTTEVAKFCGCDSSLNPACVVASFVIRYVFFA
uniref:Uncharacterized protein n=1 Tax=Triticum urartu TaxID=4572 RepID=A0A8R7US22_TRIUA